MKLREIILAQRKKVLNERLESKQEELRASQQEAEGVKEAVNEAVEDSDFEALEAKVDELDAAIAAINEEIETITGELSQIEDEEDELSADKEEVVEEVKTNKNDDEKEEREEVSSMKNRKFTEEQMQLRKAINEFIRSKGAYQERVEGFKVVDAGALIPEEFLAPVEGKSDILNLTKYIRTIDVTTGSGSYPVLSKSKAKMVTVAELEENPELAKPAIVDVDFKIETYRGALAISQEALDDADYDILSIVEEDAKNQELNTKNAAIAEVLKTARPVDAEGVDGLKTVINKEVPKVYNSKLFVTASLYNELDLLKDKNGRYLIQPDVTKDSGYVLFNKEVVVVDDELLGAEGELKAFYGDAYEFVTHFNRKQTTINWDVFDIYGKRLGLFSRFDMTKTAEDAGVFITYTPAQTV